jgi:hypothetical protein
MPRRRGTATERDAGVVCRRLRRSYPLGGAAAGPSWGTVASVAVLVAVVAASCSRGRGSVSLPPGARSVHGGCGSTGLYRGGRPDWTVTSGAPVDLVEALGHRDQVAAFIFGELLPAGHPDNPANKILWVVRQPRDGSELVLSGHPVGRSTPSVEFRRPADSVRGRSTHRSSMSRWPGAGRSTWRGTATRTRLNCPT